MSIRSILMGVEEVNFQGQKITGHHFERESRTMSRGFAINHDGRTVVGGGATRSEARQNALEALSYEPTAPPDLDY